MGKLRACTIDLTTEQVFLLDFKPNKPLPHDCLPLVWLTGHVLEKLWFFRQKKKICQLNELRSDLEAKLNLMRETK